MHNYSAASSSSQHYLHTRRAERGGIADGRGRGPRIQRVGIYGGDAAPDQVGPGWAGRIRFRLPVSGDGCSSISSSGSSDGDVSESDASGASRTQSGAASERSTPHLSLSGRAPGEQDRGRPPDGCGRDPYVRGALAAQPTAWAAWRSRCDNRKTPERNTNKPVRYRLERTDIRTIVRARSTKFVCPAVDRPCISRSAVQSKSALDCSGCMLMVAVRLCQIDVGSTRPVAAAAE